MRGFLFSAVVALAGTANGAAIRRQDDFDDYEAGAQILAPKERAAAVKDAFLFAWNGYYANAFPNDELRTKNQLHNHSSWHSADLLIDPVSNKSSNSRNGWGASAVDALSTAIIMDAKPVVDQILNYVPKINFTVTPLKADSSYVSLFEVGI